MKRLITEIINDYSILKKKYGEKFAQLCRELFPTILEQGGALSKLIQDKFAPSKFLYDDIVNSNSVHLFKDYIYSLYETKFAKNNDIQETPEQLFDKVGYILYKCKTDEDVHKFEHYYAPGEKLCTFKDPNRIKNNIIFFAVKKNVDKIKREDFKSPKRQDEYGTSVISLQFTRGNSSILSIKNRYNHTVVNPDATFSNDLENICAGLTDSFEKYYGIKQLDGKHTFYLDNYVMARDGKFYRFNYELDNVYYCVNNVIISNFDGKNERTPQYYDKGRYELIDSYLLDKQEKYFVNIEIARDGFFKEFFNKKIAKIDITKNGEERTFHFTLENNDTVTLIVNKYNQIVEYHSDTITELPENFMRFSKHLRKLHTPNVVKIGSYTLRINTTLTDFDMPSLETIEDCVLYQNNSIENINCPKLKHLGAYCFSTLEDVQYLILDSLESMSDSAFQSCKNLIQFIAPNLKKIGRYCLYGAINLQELYIPNVESIGSSFMFFNNKLTEFIAPKLECLGSRCFQHNVRLKKLDLPSLRRMENHCFLHRSFDLTNIELPNLEYLDDSCFQNSEAERVYVPKLRFMGTRCFLNNNNLKEFIAPQAFNIPKYIADIIEANNSRTENLN